MQYVHGIHISSLDFGWMVAKCLRLSKVCTFVSYRLVNITTICTRLSSKSVHPKARLIIFTAMNISQCQFACVCINHSRSIREDFVFFPLLLYSIVEKKMSTNIVNASQSYTTTSSIIALLFWFRDSENTHARSRTPFSSNRKIVRFYFFFLWLCISFGCHVCDWYVNCIHVKFSTYNPVICHSMSCIAFHLIWFHSNWYMKVDTKTFLAFINFFFLLAPLWFDSFFTWAMLSLFDIEYTT